jgi:hypothetical protein
MRRYFFDLIGPATKPDTEGTAFPTEGAARQEAALRGLNGKSHRLQHYVGFDSISLRDEDGRIVCVVRIEH